MWPAIFVFGSVALVAYTFTKVGKKDPSTAVALAGNTAPLLTEMTDAEFAAAKAAGQASTTASIAAQATLNLQSSLGSPSNPIELG